MSKPTGELQYADEVAAIRSTIEVNNAQKYTSYCGTFSYTTGICAMVVLATINKHEYPGELRAEIRGVVV